MTDVWLTGCGVLLERVWEETLNCDSTTDCCCPLCYSDAIYDERMADGTVCLRCGQTMQPELLCRTSCEFICISCDKALKKSGNEDCPYCLAPFIDGRCGAYDT